MQDTLRYGIIGSASAYGATALSVINAIDPYLRFVALVLGIAVSIWSLYRLWNNR